MTKPRGGLFTSPDGERYTVTFFLVCSLFLLWGFCNGLIDVMDKHFQDQLHLTKAQSAWVQTAHYLGYALMALPAGFLARAIGYKGSIITGLLIVSAGGFWFLAATHIASFWSFLLGVCVIAMGLTVLETVANPYTTVLGNPQLAAFRINLAQSFNGVGWMLGPFVGAMFFYSAGGAEAAQRRLYIPYFAVGVIVLVMAFIFHVARVPDLKAPDEYHLDDAASPRPARSIWAQPHFVGAVIAQFAYVAAQAGIFSFLINYLIAETPAISDPQTGAWLLERGVVTPRGNFWMIDERGAARLQGLVGFGLFTLGRMVGSAVLSRVPASRVLAGCSLANTALCAIVVMKVGWLSVAALFASFFFMSISFPTIFALGIHGLGLQSKRASAFIVMAICGAALLPKLMGHVGDKFNMSSAFLVPLVCFSIIAGYALAWPRLSRAASATRESSLGAV
jgi:FHS family L-fucose permease-like MFS transporter